MSDWTCQKTQQAGRATLQKDFFTDDRVVKVKFNACKMCVYWQLWDALGSKLCLHTVAYISAIKWPAEWQWRWAANSDRGDSGEKSSTNWTRNQSGVCLNPLLLTFLPVFLLHFWTIICSKHVFFLMGLHSAQRPLSVAGWKNRHRGEKQLWLAVQFSQQKQHNKKK